MTRRGMAQAARTDTAVTSRTTIRHRITTGISQSEICLRLTLPRGRAVPSRLRSLLSLVFTFLQTGPAGRLTRQSFLFSKKADLQQIPVVGMIGIR
ncbi:MAG: hypothetical protein VR64_01005 [Desulfatitalea sp. BRH_c12]|nr:MAG: hypothetical protein VR64_01005 [Desulfatitalea sp. BRH_c12]